VYYDQEKADHAIKFIKNLKHTKGIWRGTKFTVLPWQDQAVRDIFGTVRDNGYRQYTTAYLEVPKKMGKSELGAAIALLCMTSDNEWAAEVYGCAADRMQASIIFDVAVDMVDQSPALKKVIKPVLSQKRLVYMPTRSFYQVLSSEAYSKHGLNVHAVIFDELHAQPTRELYDVMTDGSGDARTQPLFFFVTTAGDDPDHESVGWEVHQKAVDILTGAKVDPTFYTMIYGADNDNKRIWTGREYEAVDEIDWGDESLWHKVNPSLGHTVQIDKVRDQYVSSRGNLAKEKNFRWLRLNSWEKIKSSKWLGLDFWDLCKRKIDTSRLEGRTCYGGLDLSSKIDLTSFALLFPPDDINKKWVVLPWFWIPEEAIKERVERDHVKYDEWVREGYLNTTPGNVIDYAYIEQQVLHLRDRFNILEVGFDPWNATQTAIHLQDAGLTMVEARQGYKTMSPAMKEIEQLAMGKKIIHDGHPVLRWNIGNVEVKMDENENIRPIKGRRIERIDGLVAMINAMTRAIVYKDATSVYENPDYDLVVL
jgi:phage terminase large subunit-like protein